MWRYIVAGIAGGITVIIFFAVLLMWTAAFAHGEYAWIEKYRNRGGVPCCGKVDATVITHAVANGAAVGSVIIATFPDGATLSVTVDIILPTEDPKGRPWITKYGCLFRHFGG